MTCDVAKSLGDPGWLPYVPCTGAALRFKVRILGGIQVIRQGVINRYSPSSRFRQIFLVSFLCTSGYMDEAKKGVAK